MFNSKIIEIQSKWKIAMIVNDKTSNSFAWRLRTTIKKQVTIELLISRPEEKPFNLCDTSLCGSWWGFAYPT
jgi:hypothetical protein